MSLRNRTTIAVLRVRDDVIVMQTMMWPDEIRQPDFGSVDTSDAKPPEVQMANMLVETLAGDFEPDEFEDDYREALEDAGPRPRSRAARSSARRSRRRPPAARSSTCWRRCRRASTRPSRPRGEATSTADGCRVRATKKSASKKSTAKKAPAKKAAKKTTTKKSAAKKAAKKAS